MLNLGTQLVFLLLIELFVWVDSGWLPSNLHPNWSLALDDTPRLISHNIVITICVKLELLCSEVRSLLYSPHLSAELGSFGHFNLVIDWVVGGWVLCLVAEHVFMSFQLLFLRLLLLSGFNVAPTLRLPLHPWVLYLLQVVLFTLLCLDACLFILWCKVGHVVLEVRRFLAV
jgi:hypothetical protein